MTSSVISLMLGADRSWGEASGHDPGACFVGHQHAAVYRDLTMASTAAAISSG